MSRVSHAVGDLILPFYERSLCDNHHFGASHLETSSPNSLPGEFLVSARVEGPVLALEGTRKRGSSGVFERPRFD